MEVPRLPAAGPLLVAVLVTVVGLAAVPAPGAAQDRPGSGDAPRSILVHLTHGPENPTRAALGFAVARAAQEQGHSVSVFLAGDAVQLLREGVLDHLEGLGTGTLRQHHDAVVAGGARFYLSGGSSRARGLEMSELEGLQAEFAGPAELVRLTLEHDRTFTY